jgi:hypothetical protein
MRPGAFDAVARRLGDAEERDRRRAQRGGEVRESGVDAHDERRARHERGGVGQRQPRRHHRMREALRKPVAARFLAALPHGRTVANPAPSQDASTLRQRSSGHSLSSRLVPCSATT